MKKKKPMIEERILTSDEKVRLKHIQKWPIRLLMLRQKTGMKDNAFCEKYGISAPCFNRAKNYATSGVIASHKNFLKVELSLNSEGV